MLERKSKNREQNKLIDCPRRSPRLHYETQISAQSPGTPKPAETRRGRPDSLSTPLTKIKKTSHGVLENGGGKGTQSKSEKSRNGCRRSARTQRRASFSIPGLEKQSAKRKPQTRSTVGGCRTVSGVEDSVERSRRSERRDGGANVGKRGEFVIEKRVTRSSVRRNKVVVHVISDSGSEEDSGGSPVVVSEERKKEVSVDEKKNVGEFEKRATRSSSRTCMKKASNVPCSNNEVSDPDWEEDSGVSKYWKNKVGVDKEKKVGEFEKRATRSSGKTCKKKVSNVSCSNNEYSESDSEQGSDESALIVSENGKNKVCIHKEKRAPRRPSKTCMKKATSVSNTSRPKAIISDEVEPKGDGELLKVDMNKKDVNDCGVVRRDGDQDCARKEQIGDKRKRDGVVEEYDTAQGWSKEQEFALQRAYFTAKPTPQFWKKVSRMVPGKSAEECFDRIHSDHITPPQPRTRSRAKIKDPSPLSFSASKLLSPAATKTRRVGFKRKTLLAQKTVRHILQKQQKEDQDYSADLFAVLEPTISPVPLQEGASFLSPPLNKTASFLTGCRQISSSSGKKHVSRIGSLQKAAFTSPPVLKQIKNKALHEKYIDQLHCRDAKRKAEALRNSRNAKDRIDEKVNHLKQNLVKVAKDALVSDAQDAISKFQSLLYRDGDDDSTNSSDDDDDEENDGV